MIAVYRHLAANKRQIAHMSLLKHLNFLSLSRSSFHEAALVNRWQMNERNTATIKSDVKAVINVRTATTKSRKLAHLIVGSNREYVTTRNQLDHQNHDTLEKLLQNFSENCRRRCPMNVNKQIENIKERIKVDVTFCVLEINNNKK